MKVIRHQRPRQTVNTRLFEQLLEAFHEIAAVVIAEKYVAAFDAANYDVLE